MAESQKNPPIEGAHVATTEKLSFLKRTATRFPRATRAVGITAAVAGVVGVVAVVRNRNESDSAGAENASEDNFNSPTDHPVSEA